MNDIDASFLISIMKRRMPLILTSVVLAVSAAIFVALILPRTFTATAKILVESPQIPVSLARSTIPTSPIEQLQILQQQITARDSLVSLAAKLGIYADARVRPGEEDIVRNLISRMRFDQMALDLPDRGQATVYAISFNASNPVLAARVANELAQMVLDKNQRQRTGRAGSTLQFFNQEVANLDAQLRQTEAKILKFKNENKDTLPESLEYRRNLQGSLQERRASLEREEAELRTRKNTLIVTYTGNSQPGGVPQTPEQQMLAELNRALAEQLAIFREDSPNIQALRARIAAIQKAMLDGAPAGEGKIGEQEAAAQPSLFGLDLQLSDIDDRLKNITSEKAAIVVETDHLNSSIAATPATETVLNAFLRTHENIQTQYNAAIARRAEASTGEQIEMRSDGGRFTLLENAIPPVNPVSPKRKMIVALGGLGGMGLGFGIAFLLEFINKTVRRPKDIERLLQTPPLGTIPMLVTSEEIRAWRLRKRLATATAASAVPAFLAAAHYFYMPLNLALVKLLAGLGWTGVIGT